MLRERGGVGGLVTLSRREFDRGCVRTNGTVISILDVDGGTCAAGSGHCSIYHDILVCVITY